MLYKMFGFVRDNTGAIIPNATVDVLLAGSRDPATIYDANANVIMGSALLTDTNGYFEFYVDNLQYQKSQRFELIITFGGITSTYNNLSVEYETAAGGPTSSRPLGLGSNDTGFTYFDSTLGYPIWWDGTAWYDLTALLQDLINHHSPPGSMMMWPGETPPDGWFERDGSPLLIASYSVLYGRIGTIFGGDGATTFNLPDDRGLFERGWSHASGVDIDAAARTAPTGGSLGSGNHVGTLQVDAFKYHTHVSSIIGGSATYGLAVIFGGESWGDTATGYAGNSWETRPINRAYMPIIKY